ncbi:hypothetical protein BJ508DRAFT_358598 [Ascobolus immersus RN42]|uniref:Uncharacterized protein n=1 Tax=Ascobolus immersus RN42 TaxID=1160509 RepID=A0A3N4IKA5_ASCIM|nr:hypothetical protein BJ508DRAFT_358598 [Ascobolus immersus RN42]
MRRPPRPHLSTTLLTLLPLLLLAADAFPHPFPSPQTDTGSTPSSSSGADDGIKVWPNGYFKTDASGNKVLEPGLYCRDARPQDILLYFLLNYVTHAFTLKSFPGDGAIYSVSLSLLSLLFPYAGILKAWDSIRSGTLRKKPDLDRAREAGALAIVGRDYGWKPSPKGGERIWCWNTSKDVRGRVSTWASLIGDAEKTEESVRGRYERGAMTEAERRKRPPIPKVSLTFDDPHPLLPLNPKHVSLHGQIKLPPGYRLLTLPYNVPVVPIFGDPAPETTLAFSHNWPKSLTSIVQIVFSCITIYRSRGPQIRNYGYAAYSLTLVPYMLMTFLNLLSHIFTPDFPAVYLVSTGVMDEAKARGGIFEGVVGRVAVDRVEDIAGNAGDAESDNEERIPGFPVHFREKDINGGRAFVVGFDSKPGTPMGFRPTERRVGASLEEISEKNFEPRDSNTSEHARRERERNGGSGTSEYARRQQDTAYNPPSHRERDRRSSRERSSTSTHPHRERGSGTSDHPRRERGSNTSSRPHRGHTRNPSGQELLAYPTPSENMPRDSSDRHSAERPRHSSSRTRSHPERQRPDPVLTQPRATSDSLGVPRHPAQDPDASFNSSRPVSELLPHPSQQSRFAGPAAFLEAILDIPYVVVAAPTKSDSWLKKHVFHRNTFKAAELAPPQPQLLLSCLSLPPVPYKHKRWYSPRSRWFRGVLIIWLIIVPYLVIYAFTRWEKGERSTPAMRGWILAWLSMGQILGLGMVGVWKEWRGIGENWKDRWKGGWGALCILAYAVPAIGGMVMVGKMQKEGGICEYIS